MDEFEEIVKERLDELYEEEENQEGETPSDEQNAEPDQQEQEEPPMAGPDQGGDQDAQPPEEGQEDKDDGQKDSENQEGENNEEDAFSAESLPDFLKKTETEITVKKEGCMPSPIFGPNDTRNRNKYRVSVKNGKGSTNFIFWDSIANEKKPLDPIDALADFGMSVSDYEQNKSYEDFKSAFGYEDAEDDLAQKAYNGCRQMFEDANKMFTKPQIEELKRLSSER